MEAADGGRRLSVELQIDTQGRRNYSVNKQRVRKVAEVRGRLPSVVFAPDDLALVKGSAEKRRAVLDSLGDQLSATYEALRKEYDRILKQRNAALREGQQEVAKTLGFKLAETGARYTRHRMSLLDRLAPLAAEVHSEIAAGESLAIEYVSPWAEAEGRSTDRQDAREEEIRRGLERTAIEEQARGTTLVGPHRDDIEISVEQAPARAFASQGQQRSIALSWKLAEVSVIEEIAGSPPVLLLDDVMSELDEGRRAALVESVDGSTQTVVTTTNLHYFSDSILERAHVLELGP
jgi:DNA replication and repair protein RecF